MGLNLDSEGGDQVLLARINHNFLADPNGDRRTQKEIRKGRLEKIRRLSIWKGKKEGRLICFSTAQVYTLISDSPALFVNKTKEAAMGGGHTRVSRSPR